MIDPNALNIFTDGSSKPNPRRGGTGILFVYPESYATEQGNRTKEIKLAGYKGATNNQMELKACTLALREAMKLPEFTSFQRLVIFTDSQYVVDNLNNARFIWFKNKWNKKSGEPVLNADLWKELVKMTLKIGKPVAIRWVKGHAKSEENKIADRLAKQSAQKPASVFNKSVIVRRRGSAQKTEKGSVKMEGQRLSIRVISSEYLATHKLFRLRYTVISKQSPYFGKTDFLFSSQNLRPNHSFSIRVNENNSFAQIAKVFREIGDLSEKQATKLSKTPNGDTQTH